MTIIRASIRALIVPLFAATGAFALLPSSSNAAEEISGKAVYERYCAVCHGIDGKGGGPMAEVLKPAATDLTLIAKGNEGAFPYDRVYEIIDSNVDVMGHGSQQMPVWGDAFRRDADNPLAYPRILELVFYLKSIQQE